MSAPEVSPPARRPLPPVRPGFSDHIFGAKHGIDLPLRFWPPAGGASGTRTGPAPWLLWLHGGSFAGGKWSAPTAWVPRAFCERGYAVVSVGYRLLPDVTLEEILEDCTAAHAWCVSELAELAGIDPEACVVGGASAGATAATLLPFRIPGLRAVVNVYGMVDVFDRVHHDPLPFPVDPPVTDTPEEDLEADLHVRNPARALTQAPWVTDIPPAVGLDECRAHLGIPEYAPTHATYYRIDLVNYMTRRRIMLRLALDAAGAPRDEFEKRLAAVNTLTLLDTVDSYPPTFMLNGTADGYVPVREPRKMAARLRSMGVPVGEVYPEGKDHVFDWEIQTPEDWGWKECVVPLMDFVDCHAKQAAKSQSLESTKWSCRVM